MTVMPNTEDAREQGRRDYHAGLHYNHCPYGWWGNIAWRSGWREAQREEQAKTDPLAHLR